MDISSLMKLREAWNTFSANHPKFPGFVEAIKARGIPEGSVVEMSVKYPDGAVIKTNVKVTQSDTELLGMIK